MARALLKIICSLAFAAVSSPGAAQIVASGAADETSRAGETSRTAWIKTFAAAPIEAQARFEAPDYHGTLIEAAARRLMRDALEARGYRAAGADDGDDILTLSIDVETPAPQGRRPLPKAPIRITSQDRIPGDNIYDPKIDLEFAPPPRKRAGAAREIRVTIYARSGEKRVWSGYAGADSRGASREEIAGGLVAALIDHFGEDADLADAPFALAETAPIVQIVEPVE